MNRTLLTLGLLAVVALAGCSGLPGADEPTPGTGVDVADESAGATNVSQSVVVRVNETTAGQELTAVGATYPRDRFVVSPVGHDQIRLGVDRDGDGTLDRNFNETHVSGVNTNDYSFDVTLDTGYTLERGDLVVVDYPAVDNPDEPGEYTVEVRLNDRQRANVTVTTD